MSCPLGAIRNPALGRYFQLQYSDLEAWFPGAVPGFLFWLRPYVGRIYDLDYLAALNPDAPAGSTWQDFLSDLLTAWAHGGTPALSSWADQYITYKVFQYGCLCVGGACVDFSDAGPYDATLVGQYNGGRSDVPTGLGTVNLELLATRGTFGGAGQVEFALSWDNPPGTHLAWDRVSNVFLAYGAPYDYVSDVPPVAATGWRGYFYVSSGGSGAWPTIQWTSKYCGPTYGHSDPAAAPEPAYTEAPTTPAPTGTTLDQLETKLDYVIARLAGVQDLAKATQRSIAPQAYTLGMPQNVSGSGSIVLANMVGCLVYVTSVPPGWGSGPGTDPRRIPSTGAIRFGTGDGATRGTGVRHMHQIVPCDLPYADRLLYTFATGVLATITPVLREP